MVGDASPSLFVTYFKGHRGLVCKTIATTSRAWRYSVAQTLRTILNPRWLGAPKRLSSSVRAIAWLIPWARRCSASKPRELKWWTCISVLAKSCRFCQRRCVGSSQLSHTSLFSMFFVTWLSFFFFLPTRNCPIPLKVIFRGFRTAPFFWMLWHINQRVGSLVRWMA